MEEKKDSPQVQEARKKLKRYSNAFILLNLLLIIAGIIAIFYVISRHQ